jgi:hypothetical protein
MISGLISALAAMDVFGDELRTLQAGDDSFKLMRIIK